MNVSRRRYMGAKGGSIPYQRIEYLAYGNKSSINLGFNDYCEFELVLEGANGSSSQMAISLTNNGASARWFGVFSSTNKWGVGSTSGQLSSISATTKVTALVKFQQSRIDVVVNNETIGRGNAATTGMQDYRLFNGLTNYKYFGKIFSVKTTNGIKDLDLIPVRIGTVGYMYDQISGELYGDEGTGTFVLGPDIN